MILFGGTFDPIHRGHILAASHVSEVLGDRPVVLMLAPEPQIREPPQANFEQRWEMLQLACADNPKLQPSRFERRQAGPTRTVQTLRDLSNESNETIVWVLGSDSFATLSGWHEFGALKSLASFFVLHRKGVPEKPPSYGLKSVDRARQLLTDSGLVFVSSKELLPVSATEIRRKLAAKLDVSELVPALVLDHIMKNRLYTPNRL